MTVRIRAAEASPEAVVDAMQADGACVVTEMLTQHAVAAARASLDDVVSHLPTGRNDFEGFRTRRIYALFAKTRAFDAPALHPLVLGVLDRVLGHYQLSAPTGIVIGPGEKPQVLHRDQNIYPLPPDFGDVVVNTMWALDDFTADNGATRYIPGSHRWREGPSSHKDVAVALMPAGSVLFYLGKLWHGGGANTTDLPRWGVILEYVSAWLRPQENHILAVPRETAASLPERLQELLGYNIYPPFLGYVDGRHPARCLQGDASPDPSA